MGRREGEFVRCGKKGRAAGQKPRCDLDHSAGLGKAPD